MNLFRCFEEDITAALQALIAEGRLPAELDLSRIAVEPPRDAGHGDVTTNAALVLAAAAGMRPHQLAEVLAERLAALKPVAAVEVAGPGFINLRLREGFWHARLADVLTAGEHYGDSNLGAQQPVNVEFVSANPTGPLHVGHGRGAVVGDALASLLEKAGYRVSREYYINDGGAQVTQLALSLRARYLVALGRESEEAFEAKRAAQEIAYPGDYLAPLAEALVERDGERWHEADEADWLPVFERFAVEQMMALIEDDLRRLGVRFDTFMSESALIEAGAVEEALTLLKDKGLLYEGVLEPPKGKQMEDWEPVPQTLFRSTAFGDDVDRPLRKADGSWTYFAADIAYHLDKFRRGFRTMVDVWGADHGGYVKRMQAAVKAVTDGHGELDVKLCQMVNLLEGGEPVKMSKRAGAYVTLSEVVERVGRGVFRFMMLTRRNDASLDFDFDKVIEQSRENPVFYVQYAHARCCSVLRHAAAELGGEATRDEAMLAAPFGRLVDPAELNVIKSLAGWPWLMETAADAHEPHRVAFYLQDLAALFHLLWTKGKEDARLRFIDGSDPEATAARLALVRGVQLVIASGLRVFGVEPLEELR